MKTAPEHVSETARQSWRAVSCIWALTVLILGAALIAPEAMRFGRVGFDVALALAGFALTRLLLDGPTGPRGGIGAAACAALWGVPVLATVCTAVLAAGLLLLPPADLRNQAWTTLWTVLGGSGAELLKQGGWSPASSDDLLLHGWIWGVAAQLALGWGFLVGVMRFFGAERRIGPVALAGAAVAMALGVWMRGQGADIQSFYLAPPRSWAFLLGAAAATRCWPPVPAPGPGVAWLARAGRAALPFYLWIWPLLVLPRMILARALEPLEVAVAGVAAAGLAWTTMRWIDRPLRRALEGRPLRALAVCAAMLAGVAAASAAIFALDGLPGRAPAAVRAEEAGAQAAPPLQTLCHTEGVDLPSAAVCTVPSGGRADVVLWGNSHTSQLSPALLTWAQARGRTVRQATRSGCGTLLETASGLASPDCVRFNRAALAEWRRTQPELIVLGAGWTVILERAPQADLAALDAALERTLRTVRAAVGPQARIVVVGNMPDYDFAPGACHARRAFLGLDTRRCDRARPANSAAALVSDARLERIVAGMPGVFVFSPFPALCDGDLCRTRGRDRVWYRDRSHMTEAGGQAQTPALSAVLDRAMADR